MRFDLDTAFQQGATAVRKITLVGATSREMQLYGNDFHTMINLNKTLERLGFDLSDDLQKTKIPGSAEPADDLSNFENVIEKINAHPTEGGLDFLADEVLVDTDVLGFCNLPYEQCAREDYMDAFRRALAGHSIDDISPDILGALNKMDQSFGAGAHMGDTSRWLRKIDESGAKIAYFSGFDDFPPEKLAGSDFICIKDTTPASKGVLIRCEFLLRAAHEKRLPVSVDVNHSPLTQLASLAQGSEGRRVFKADLTGRSGEAFKLRFA